MSLFKMKRGQESKVSSLAKEDGSLIFSLNGANDSTVRLDQSVNGTVQRLGIAVDKAKSADSASNASSAIYAKNADTIDGFHYSEAPYKYSKTFNQPVSNAVWYLKVKTSDWNRASETIRVHAVGNNRSGSTILKVGSRQANWWGYATQYNGTCLTGVKVIISNSNDTYLRFDEGTTQATIYTTFSATIETSTVTDGYISIPGEGGIFGNVITGTFKGTADNSNALGGSSLAQVLSAAGSGKFLPLAGGNMTGDIGYAGSKATYSMIKFIDNKADTYGNGIAIGGGGLTIIGGGESAAVIAAQHSSGGDENMVVANDDSIDFYTNCQNGFTSAKHITMNTDGSVTASTFNGFATNSDKLDGYHENSFLRYRNATSTAGKNTLWDQIGIQEYDNCYPDGLTNGIYGYGEVISLPSNSARFDLWVNHNSSNQISNGLQYRSGWGNDKKSWRMILDSVNYTNYAAAKNSYNNASISDATIKLGRSDGSTGTTLTVNNVANASSANYAKNSAALGGSSLTNITNQINGKMNKYRSSNQYGYGYADLNGTMPPFIFAYKNGYPLHTDPEFKNSNNGIVAYDNSESGNVTIERIAMNSGNSSGYVLKISNKGLANPGLGGWYFGDSTAYAKQFTCIFRAKIPSGRNVQFGSNPIGTNGSHYWLTEHVGTGKWEWYAYHVDCGSANFSSTNFFYIDGAIGTASAPVVWYLSYANTIVNSYGNYDGLRTRYADTASNSANSSSAIFSTYSAYPQGFDSRSTSATWGNTTGTFITGWHTASGGDVAFMNNNPSNGKVSMKLDGYFYQNEGSKRVLDTDDIANIVQEANKVISITKSITLKTDWQDTGIEGADLETGTYIVQISGIENNSTPGIYGEIWSGIFSWYSRLTNSTNAEEILLHNAGHADNSNEIYLRTIRQGKEIGKLKLQIAAKQAGKSAANVVFKFRKMI